MKQKSRIQWLQEGNQNSSYFFKCIKGRSRHSINALQLENEFLISEKKQIKKEIVKYFKDILPKLNMDKGRLPLKDLLKYKVPNYIKEDMANEITNDNIKKTIFEMSNDKAPWPNGFGALFFKATREIIGNDVCKAIQQFFAIRHLLKELNCTIISLVPKCENPSSCKDFRPISCCNVIYNCITKILVNKLKTILSNFINKGQTTFVRRRNIGDNILIYQELLLNFHKKDRNKKKCVLKLTS